MLNKRNNIRVLEFNPDLPGSTAKTDIDSGVTTHAKPASECLALPQRWAKVFSDGGSYFRLGFSVARHSEVETEVKVCDFARAMTGYGHAPERVRP